MSIIEDINNGIQVVLNAATLAEYNLIKDRQRLDALAKLALKHRHISITQWKNGKILISADNRTYTGNTLYSALDAVLES